MLACRWPNDLETRPDMSKKARRRQESGDLRMDGGLREHEVRSNPCDYHINSVYNESRPDFVRPALFYKTENL